MMIDNTTTAEGYGHQYLTRLLPLRPIGHQGFDENKVSV